MLFENKDIEIDSEGHLISQDAQSEESEVPGICEGPLRPVLSPRVYTLPMVRAISKTMVQSKNCGPQITVKRLSTRFVKFSIDRAPE